MNEKKSIWVYTIANKSNESVPSIQRCKNIDDKHSPAKATAFTSIHFLIYLVDTISDLISAVTSFALEHHIQVWLATFADYLLSWPFVEHRRSSNKRWVMWNERMKHLSSSHILSCRHPWFRYSMSDGCINLKHQN